MSIHRPKIVIDLDGTLAHAVENGDYANARPNTQMIARLVEYRESGFEIAIHTARNMRTHANSLGKINAKTLPIIVAWLERHGVPYDEIHVGKPWCGPGGFYVDDKAVRPDEFVRMTLEEIAALVGDAAPQ